MQIARGVHLDENAVAAFLGGELPPNEASCIVDEELASAGKNATWRR